MNNHTQGREKIDYFYLYIRFVQVSCIFLERKLGMCFFCCVIELIDNRLPYHQNTAMQNVALYQEKKKKEKDKMIRENMKFKGESDLIAWKKGILIREKKLFCGIKRV